MIADSGDSILTVLTNSGAGRFARAGTIGVGGAPQFLIATDWNGDGFLDLVSVDPYSDVLAPLLNNGRGAFSTREIIDPGSGSGPYAVAAADLDLDGRIDVVTVNAFDSTVTIATNSDPPFLDRLAFARPSGFRAAIHGAAEAFAIEVSTNLQNWTRLAKAISFTGPFWDSIDFNFHDAPHRFTERSNSSPLA